jgi:3',5'-cyclic AMP phosphodiesterase CpdA
MRRLLFAIAFASLWLVQPAATPFVLIGTEPGSLHFAVIGDAGTGERPQYDVANQLWAARPAFDFDLVLLLGDNMYGRQNPSDFVDKFERPYESLLNAGVRFFATLGNHDKPANRDYPGFNMDGRRYYTFVREHVRFVVLDSNRFDPEQARWAEDTLARAAEPWTIVYFHHPIYSDGKRHGSNVELRVAIEPLLVDAGVRVVFNGHEHFYERTRPQKGITYFIAGSGGQLRRGGVRRSAMTAAAFDDDQAFMIVEVGADRLNFQTISRTGLTVDTGAIDRRPTT